MNSKGQLIQPTVIFMQADWPDLRSGLNFRIFAHLHTVFLRVVDRLDTLVNRNILHSSSVRLFPARAVPLSLGAPNLRVTAVAWCRSAHCIITGYGDFGTLYCILLQQQQRAARYDPVRSNEISVVSSPCWTGFAWFALSVLDARSNVVPSCQLIITHMYFATRCSCATGSCLLLCFLPRFVCGDFSLFLLRRLNNPGKRTGQEREGGQGGKLTDTDLVA